MLRRSSLIILLHTCVLLTACPDGEVSDPTEAAGGSIPPGARPRGERQAWYRGTTQLDTENLDRFFASPLAQRWSEYEDAAAQALPKVGVGARGLTLSWLATEGQARKAVPEAVALIDGYGGKPTFAFPYLLQAFVQMPQEHWRPAMEATLQLRQRGQSNHPSRYTVDGLPTLQFFGQLPNQAAMQQQGAFAAELMACAQPPVPKTQDRGHAFVVEALLNGFSLVDVNARADLTDVVRWSLDVDRRLGTAWFESASAPYPYEVLLQRVGAAARIVGANAGPDQRARVRQFVESTPELIAPQADDGRKLFTDLLTTLGQLRSNEEFQDFARAQTEIHDSRPADSVAVLEAAVIVCNPTSTTCGPLSRQAIVRDAAQLWRAFEHRDNSSIPADTRQIMVHLMSKLPERRRAQELHKARVRIDAGQELKFVLRGLYS